MPKPIVNANKIPKVMETYVIAPVGPLISIGDVSEIYLGQNTENAPTATPYINLPRHKTQKISIKVKSTPIASTQLKINIEQYLPRDEKLEEMDAPTIAPTIVILETIIILLVPS